MRLKRYVCPLLFARNDDRCDCAVFFWKLMRVLNYLWLSRSGSSFARARQKSCLRFETYASLYAHSPRPIQALTNALPLVYYS
jgi:hypothetical protein